tara:strand:- start:91 stop:699 length:609 start_codon:yes stop_codon:yes gene_type:complete
MSPKGIDTGKQGRAVLVAQSWKINSKIFKSGKKKCSRCKKIKLLSGFRPIPKKQQNKKGIVIYVSHCNACDAKRTAKFKSLKGSTIEGSAYYLMSNVKRRCRDKKLKNEININWIVARWYKQKGLCHYTKLKMNFLTNRKSSRKGGGYKKNNRLNVSLDRINPSLGYLKSNVVLCAWLANNMKQDLYKKEFIKYCRIISSNY